VTALFLFVMPASYRLVSRIPEIIAKLDPETLQGVRDAADEIVEGAQERVKQVSGDLHDSIHVEIDGMETRVVAGNSKVWYGHIVEHGSVQQDAGPRPFLIPAYEAVRPSIEEIIGEELKNL
jgi:HK97 gp10 family phage protein